MGEPRSESESTEDQEAEEQTDEAPNAGDEASSDASADSPKESGSASEALNWPSPLQETLIAAFGSTAAVICASMLAGTGSSVETLARLSLAFCITAGFSTWFLPKNKSSPRMTRIGSWAGLACILYWLGPIQIAEVRAHHDLSEGTRSEKEAAVERLMRLGARDFTGADLRELNFSDFDLGNANFSRANLTHSMFERTLLVESNLSDAKLAGANFRGANLSTAKLEGSDLGTGARSARCDRFTQLPSGYVCLHGAITKSSK